MAGDQASDQASDQAKFAAREFVARWERESGETLAAVVLDRLLFAYEMGYLRGRGDGSRAAMTMFAQVREESETGPR